ncbi:flagellar FliJ family protein [Pseudomonas aeruginosa]
MSRAAKLAELGTLAATTSSNGSARARKGVSGQWLMNYRPLPPQAETAVAQQANSVTWHREAVDRRSSSWRENTPAWKAAQLVSATWKRRARPRDKREQKQLDELAQRTRRQDD